MKFCIHYEGTQLFICDILCDLISFVQFKKREKHPWRSVTFSKVAGFQPATLLKVTLLHECFSRFLNCTNGTKSSKTSHIQNFHFFIIVSDKLKSSVKGTLSGLRQSLVKENPLKLIKNTFYFTSEALFLTFWSCVKTA